MGTALLFKMKPTGFLPTEDEGRVYITFELPEATSTSRTLEVLDSITTILRKTEQLNGLTTARVLVFLSKRVAMTFSFISQPSAGLMLLHLPQNRIAELFSLNWNLGIKGPLNPFGLIHCSVRFKGNYQPLKERIYLLFLHLLSRDWGRLEGFLFRLNSMKALMILNNSNPLYGPSLRLRIKDLNWAAFLHSSLRVRLVTRWISITIIN